MKSLKMIIVTMIVVLTLICTSSFYLISKHYSKVTLDNTIETDMNTLVQSIALAIENQNESVYTLMRGMASLPIMNDPELSLEYRQDQLYKVMIANPNIKGLSITDDLGYSISKNLEEIDLSSTPGVRYALEGKTGVTDPEPGETEDELIQYYYCPILDSSKKIIGSFFTSVNGKILSNICARFQIGQTGFPVVINRKNGNTIGDPNIQNVLDVLNYHFMQRVEEKAELSDVYDAILDYPTGQKYIHLDGIKYFVSYAPVPNTDWEVIVFAPYKEFSFRLNHMTTIMMILTAILILLGVVTAILVARSLRPLKRVGRAIAEIASGNADLTQRLEIKKPAKEISVVVNGFNQFVEKLHEIMAKVKEGEQELSLVGENLHGEMGNTSAAISEINGNIENVNNQINNQTLSVQQTAGAVNEIASNIESLERMIDAQSQGVSTASTAVEQMVGNIVSVNHAVEKMVSSFNELQANAATGIGTQSSVNERILQIEQQSKMLQDANTAISDIAEQTNLLAMNAAIEAAHAGDAGRGFSVVADEIRKLSETSSSQSKTIGDELTKIQASINEVVNESSKSTMAFSMVQSSLNQTQQIMEQIRAAMEEQQLGSKQITDSLKAMNDSTFQVKTASEEMAAGNKQILGEIQNLQSSTITMRSSVDGISSSAMKITEIGDHLSSFSDEMRSSINQIGEKIDEFKV